MNIREFISPTLVWLRAIAPLTPTPVDDGLVIAIEENKFLMEMLIRIVDRKLNGVEALTTTGETLSLTALGFGNLDQWFIIADQVAKAIQLAKQLFGK